MIYLKTPAEIQTMRTSADVISRLMGELAAWVKPGVATRRLEAVARDFIHDNEAKPACLGYEGFPAALCIEVNETVVHGFPGGYELRDGDIVGIDTVVEKDGFMADMCYTYPVGNVSDEVMDLLRTTKESLYVGIEACRAGHRIGDISAAVQRYCEGHGYGVVREMCGHGIGRDMHEDPEVPNYGRRGTGPVIRNGMVICIEPMINLGQRHIVIERDGWTCRTRDGRPSAHFEHTIAVHNGVTEPLTTFSFIEQALGDRAV